MSDEFLNRAEAGMGAIERLISGLPGIKGYRNKELRREADRALRQQLAGALTEQRQALFAVQKTLLAGGGLQWMDDVDRCVTQLQTLIDRVKSASDGYAGFFDAQKIQEAQLEALHRFDVGMLTRVGEVETTISQLAGAVAEKEKIGPAVANLTQLIAELNNAFSRRVQAISQADV